MTDPTHPHPHPHHPQQDGEDRSVRDVVQNSPEQVNDAWCSKILRKILQSLDVQYAMQMPHRAITPDTIVLHANGAPFLISDDIDAAPAPDAHQADDLTALASVIHYAITREPVPTGPLHGRADGYSAALVATIDACMDPAPARRPRSIDAALGMLGMVAPGPLAGAVPAAAPAPAPQAPAATATASTLPPAATPAPVDTQPAHPAGTRRGWRWAIAAGGGAIAIALVSFAQWRNAGSYDVAPTLQRAADSAAPSVLAQGGAAPAGAVAGEARTDNPTAAATDPLPEQAGSTASGASSGGATRAGGGVDESDDVTGAAPTPAAPVKVKAAARPRAPVPLAAVAGNASYELHIKPWGTVYVDGVERGVSPPIKRLALAPGRHTVRITHPNYRESVLEFDSAHTTSNGKIIVDFEHQDQ